METFELLETYLKEKKPLLDIKLSNFEINGSIIKLNYYYNPNYDWDKNYISYDNIVELEILDYLTWIYTKCFKPHPHSYII